MLERLAWSKHSCLLQKFVTFGRKKFYNIGPRTEITLTQGPLQACLLKYKSPESLGPGSIVMIRRTAMRQLCSIECISNQWSHIQHQRGFIYTMGGKGWQGTCYLEVGDTHKIRAWWKFPVFLSFKSSCDEQEVGLKNITHKIVCIKREKIFWATLSRMFYDTCSICCPPSPPSPSGGTTTASRHILTNDFSWGFQSLLL